jgi:hypothetical protein
MRGFRAIGFQSPFGKPMLNKQFLRPRHWGQSANNKLFIDALVIALHILISYTNYCHSLVPRKPITGVNSHGLAFHVV